MHHYVTTCLEWEDGKFDTWANSSQEAAEDHIYEGWENSHTPKSTYWKVKRDGEKGAMATQIKDFFED